MKLLFYFYLLLLFIFIIDNLCTKYRYDDGFWGTYEYETMSEVVEK